MIGNKRTLIKFIKVYLYFLKIISIFSKSSDIIGKIPTLKMQPIIIPHQERTLSHKNHRNNKIIKRI